MNKGLTKEQYAINVLTEHCPELKKRWNADGWVNHNVNSTLAQKVLVEALNKLHRQGFWFDIVVHDGTVLNNVDITEARVKLMYTCSEHFPAPANGVLIWRPSSLSPVPPKVAGFIDLEDYLNKTVKPLTEEDFKDLNLEFDYQYANDKYLREIKPGVKVDVYDVIRAWTVTDGGLQHALKKLLAAGQRGHKDYEQDLLDILASVERALAQHKEWTQK